MPYNFVADSFHKKRNFVADFLQAKSDFLRKSADFLLVINTNLRTSYLTPFSRYG